MNPNPFEYTGNNLTFIVGCPRSGTTWLQKLLSCHPKIRSGQETHLFTFHISPQLREWREHLDPKYRGGIGLGCYFTEEEFLRILKEYLVRLFQPMIGMLQPGEIFVEKTPSHALFISDILALLPEARIIHVLRDPRDTVASLMAASGTWGSAWAPNHPRDAARWWVEHVTAVERSRANIPNGQFHQIRYEELHSTPEGVLSGCATFLGLKWEEEALRKAIDSNDAKQNNKGTPIKLGGEVARLRGNMTQEPDGFVRKAKVGGWRTELSLRDRFWIWRVARKPMAAAGYRWPFFLL